MKKYIIADKPLEIIDFLVLMLILVCFYKYITDVREKDKECVDWCNGVCQNAAKMFYNPPILNYSGNISILPFNATQNPTK
jgi:hypothetical protein